MSELGGCSVGITLIRWRVVASSLSFECAKVLQVLSADRNSVTKKRW